MVFASNCRENDLRVKIAGVKLTFKVFVTSIRLVVSMVLCCEMCKKERRDYDIAPK